MTRTPEQLARECAQSWLDPQRAVWKNYSGNSPLAAQLPAAFDADERSLTALILSAIRESVAGQEAVRLEAIKALEESHECAVSIRRNLDEDMGGIPDGDIWLTTIHAHAHCIEQDARAALLKLRQAQAQEGSP
jgi:hypothetical protein